MPTGASSPCLRARRRISTPGNPSCSDPPTFTGRRSSTGPGEKPARPISWRKPSSSDWSVSNAEGGAATRSRLLRWADFDDRLDPVLAVQALEGLHRRGWVSRSGEALFLSPAGADRIGLSARTGARQESVEHRALLVAALRIFAHHHERLEILRQGRFDTRLPDGRVPLLPPPHRRGSPAELADSLDRRRADWLWRCFGGRDVHVEAEVSGATRRERIERDWTKARDAGAFLLVLVGDAGRARSVRRYLQRLDVPRTRAAVWTLPSARNVLPTRD